MKLSPLRICKKMCFAIMLTFAFLAGFAMPDYAFATSEHPVVVSLGDSYSSGEGIEPFYGQGDAWQFFMKWKSGDSYAQFYDWLAHRSESSWAGKLRMTDASGEEIVLSEAKDDNWFFAASSGAETKHFFDRNESISSVNPNDEGIQAKSLTWYETRGVGGSVPVTKDFYLPNQLDVFNRIEAGSVDYVTITLGGNDMGFVEILENAAMYSWALINPDGVYDACKEKWNNVWPDTRRNLERTYRDIQEAAGPQATIIVAGYPHLVDKNGPHLTIASHEAQEINTNVTTLNRKIKQLVDELRENDGLNIYFVSVEERFEGHEAYSEDPYLNEIILGSEDQDLDQTATVSAYSVHPNEKGAWAYARAVQQMIDRLEDEKGGIAPSVPASSGATDGKTRDIALVLDVSGSMDGDPMDEVKRATVRFGNTVLGTTAKVGVVSFDSKAKVVEPLTDNNERVAIAADELEGGGGTNMGAGLTEAANMLSKSTADKKIVILMTDGEPNEGMSDDELIAYAEKLKNQGYFVYTLGFFSGMQPGNKSAPQTLLEQIASEGCHYEVTDAADLQFFFGDIADQINGVRYNYIRIACPVDVTVNYDGETLSSGDTHGRARTSFGTLTFEDAAVDDNEGTSAGVADAVKILRLREGPEYDISINGTGSGFMDYVIGFVDDDGEYSDMRYFDGITVGPKTQITTLAKASDTTRMTVDYDGDGEIDTTYEAHASSHAEIVDNSQIVLVVEVAAALFGILIVALFVWSLIRIQKRQRSRQQA